LWSFKQIFKACKCLKAGIFVPATSPLVSAAKVFLTFSDHLLKETCNSRVLEDKTKRSFVAYFGHHGNWLGNQLAPLIQADNFFQIFILDLHKSAYLKKFLRKIVI
jgi:hypothetical protein